MQAGVDKWEAAGLPGMSVEMLDRVYGHYHPRQDSYSGGISPKGNISNFLGRTAIRSKANGRNV
jgi:hypothetical protein